MKRFSKFIHTITGRRARRLRELRKIRREVERARMVLLMHAVIADLEAEIDAAPAGSAERIRAINRLYELKFARIFAGV